MRSPGGGALLDGFHERMGGHSAVFVTGLLALVLTAQAVPARAASRAPAWLREAARLPTPEHSATAPAVILFREREVTVQSETNHTVRERGAIRILAREGRRAAQVAAIHRRRGASVRVLRAWLLMPDGEVVRYGKRDIVELGMGLDDIFDETRVRLIMAGEEVQAGSVFGYESRTDTRSVFMQDVWGFQGSSGPHEELPAVLSRYTLRLPDRWTARGLVFNRPGVEPRIEGSTYRWVTGDLGPLDPEPGRPATRSLVPWLAVGWFPPDPASEEAGAAFGDWREVAGWLWGFYGRPALDDRRLVRRARELVAGAATDLDSVRAIARYVQSIRYASIQMGLDGGGGLRPHAPTEVFAKSYGDCKDKANLMREMLAAVKIPSHCVAVFLGDRGHVREEWPSPGQFNHCVLGIRLRADSPWNAVTVGSTLGRLVIFDPTDPLTPVGALSEDLQGGLALVIDPASDTLVRLPVFAPETSRTQRLVELVLTADSTAGGRFTERSFGTSAARERGLSMRPRGRYQRLIEAFLARRMPGARTMEVSVSDDTLASVFTLDVDFELPAPMRGPHDGSVVLRPPLIRSATTWPDDGGPRRHPIVLRGEVVVESLMIHLPAGYVVEQLPDSLVLRTSFGSVEAGWRMIGGSVLCTYREETLDAELPPEDYPAVREFFLSPWKVRNSLIVLRPDRIDRAPPGAGEEVFEQGSR